jgi:hypothetical protein
MKIIMFGFAIYFAVGLIYGLIQFLLDPETRKEIFRKVLFPCFLGGIFFGFGSYYWIYDFWSKVNNIYDFLTAIIFTVGFIFFVMYFTLFIEVVLFSFFPDYYKLDKNDE